MELQAVEVVLEKYQHVLERRHLQPSMEREKGFNRQNPEVSILRMRADAHIALQNVRRQINMLHGQVNGNVDFYDDDGDSVELGVPQGAMQRRWRQHLER